MKITFNPWGICEGGIAYTDSKEVYEQCTPRHRIPSGVNYGGLGKPFDRLKLRVTKEKFAKKSFI